MNQNLIKSKPERIRSTWIPSSFYQCVCVCVLTVSVFTLLWVLLLLCVCLCANQSSGVSKRARHSRHWYWIGTSASTESTSVTSHSSENKALWCWLHALPNTISKQNNLTCTAHILSTALTLACLSHVQLLMQQQFVWVPEDGSTLQALILALSSVTVLKAWQDLSLVPLCSGVDLLVHQNLLQRIKELLALTAHVLMLHILLVTHGNCRTVRNQTFGVLKSRYSAGVMMSHSHWVLYIFSCQIWILSLKTTWGKKTPTYTDMSEDRLPCTFILDSIT